MPIIKIALFNLDLKMPEDPNDVKNKIKIWFQKHLINR